jgi:glycolate oxidase FAD binding subunit
MRADSEDQVVEAVREARARRTTLEIIGGGTRRSVGRPVVCDEVLDVSRLSGIVNYEPEELILTVKPGTPLVEIEALLASKGQRLGFDPQDWSALLGSAGTATIGGAVSCNADGPAAISSGRARDHLLGIRAVNGFGEAFKAGGRVVKNVTGFDIPKLVCGAFGTLCVLTELTFRVFPMPPESRCFALKNVMDVDGLKALRLVWSSALDATGLAYLPDKVAAFLPELGTVPIGAAVLRIEGTPASLAEKCALLRALVPDVEPVDVENTAFGKLGSGEIFAGTLWDVACDFISRPYTPSPWNAYKPYAREWDSQPLRYFDRAGMTVWITETPGLASGRQQEQSASRMLLRASAETRKRSHVFAPQEPARAALTRAVKAAFDPLGIFNPDRMYEGI